MFLCPNDMDRVTMCVMGETFHAFGVITNDSLEILPTFGNMGSNLESPIENLEPVRSVLVLCYNELHNFFSFLP